MSSRDVQTGASNRKPTVLVIGTFDTKGPEIAFVRSEVERLGCAVLTLDSGTSGMVSGAEASFTREEVAGAANTALSALGEMARGDALARMALGVERMTVSLAAEGRIHAALCIGGAGVSLAVPAFQSLELGFPKLLLTPLASGKRTFDAFVKTRDVAVMHSVADVMGVNPVTKPVLTAAAAYAAGGARAWASRDRGSPARSAFVAASMNGNTTAALMYAKDRLARSDIELVTFHANGTGGRAMEDLINEGMFSAVLDYTTTELAGELVGGLMSAGSDRMEAAGKLAIPQLLVPGCLDLITTGRYEETRAEWPGRKLYRHNPAFTLVRVNADEMAELGRVFGEKANQAVGPTHIFVPLRGFSVPNHPGGPFWDPEADRAFLEAVRSTVSPAIAVEAIDAHINDREFIDRVIDVLSAYLSQPAQVPAEMEVYQ